MTQMANAPPIECLPSLALPGGHEPQSVGDAQWVELPRRFAFTFAGLSVGAVSCCCMSLVRPLGQPPYLLTPTALRMLPEGARALHISQPIVAMLPRVSRLGRGICYVPTQGRRYLIDLTGSFAGYLSKLQKETRHNLRRRVRRYAEACGGTVEWREFRHVSEMIEFHRLASEVSSKTYQHRLLRAGIDAAPSFREELVRGALADRVRGYLLFHRGSPIAYQLARARSTDLVFEKTGFDPAYAAHSPGMVLHHVILEQLFASGEFRQLDFGEGAYEYKASLATGSIEAAEIYWFPWSLRNAAFVVSHSAVAAIGGLLRAALEAFGIAQRVKKLVRQRLRRAARS